MSEGWHALHHAATLVDATAGARLDRNGHHVTTTRYHYLVFKLPGRWGSEYGDNSRFEATAYGEYLRTLLLPQYNYRIRDRKSARRLLEDTQASFASFDKRLDFDPTTPISALRSARGLLTHCRRIKKSPITVSLLALAWIGLSVRGLLKMHFCELCFRWAIPGLLHCYEHSQSSEAPGLTTEKSLRHLRACRINDGWEYAAKIRSPAKKHAMTRTRLRLTLATLLCHYTLPSHKTAMATIRRAISRCPITEAKLFPGLAQKSDTALLALLSERLDPLETLTSSWAWKLRRCEIWNSAEKSYLAGNWRRGHRNSSKVDSAIFWARNGLSKSEVARMIRISPSTISKWLARGKSEELADVFDGQRTGRIKVKFKWK